MNLFLIVILCFFLNGSVSYAQPAKTADESDENLLMEELQDLRDPFVSPLAKKKPESPIAITQPIVAQNPAPVVRPVAVNPAPAPSFDQTMPPAIVQNLPAFSTAGIKVSGIIWNTQLPQAIINDHVVEVGDDVQGARIIGITKTGIDVIYNGIKYNLPMTDQNATLNGNSNPALRRGGR